MRVRGEWRPEYAFGAAPFALQCAACLSDARAIRALENVEPANMKKLDIGLERTHRSLDKGWSSFRFSTPGASRSRR
jgi:hypothetical protein